MTGPVPCPDQRVWWQTLIFAHQIASVGYNDGSSRIKEDLCDPAAGSDAFEEISPHKPRRIRNICSQCSITDWDGLCNHRRSNSMFVHDETWFAHRRGTTRSLAITVVAYSDVLELTTHLFVQRSKDCSGVTVHQRQIQYDFGHSASQASSRWVLFFSSRRCEKQGRKEFGELVSAPY